MDLSDYELMLQIGAGRADVLAVLYDKYQRRLFGFFVKMGFGHATSEDLVQDTFIRVLRHAKSFRNDGSFIGWLFRIARNVASDFWQEVAPLEPLDDEMAALMPTQSEHDPAGLYEQAVLEARLQRALLHLPRDSRELVLLSRISELTMAELAQLSGCSVGAVKVRLHRALLQLRHNFDGDHDAKPVNLEVDHAV